MDDSVALAAPETFAGRRTRQARVLMITPVGLAGRGGIDRLNLYLHSYLEQRGDAQNLTFIGSRGEWPGPFWGITFLAALIRFMFACAGHKHDVAHIHVSTNGSALRKVVFGVVARLFGMPYVIQYHGMICADYEQQRPLWFRALGHLARGAQRVIVLGEAYRLPFERLHVSAERIAIVHNGVPDIGMRAAIPRSHADEKIILFSGEVGERKGAHILIEALAAMSKQRGGWRCIMAGNGDVEGMRKRVQELGLSQRIAFTGWIGIDDVHRHMCEADIVVLPSRAEALPLALIEGASAGAALVSCDVGAVADVVRDGLNGLIVARDEAEIAAALEKLIDDEDLLARMQTASRQLYIECFQASVFAGALLESYRQVRKR